MSQKTEQTLQTLKRNSFRTLGDWFLFEKFVWFETFERLLRHQTKFAVFASFETLGADAHTRSVG